MKKWKLSTKAKQVLSIAFMVFSVLFFVMLVALKDKMNNYASRTIKLQAGSEIQSVPALLDSIYNYAKNGSTYQVTFLEFGAKGCSACKRMEAVMEEIKESYPTVNVVFLNILQPENQKLMKYFGVAVIPSQIILNRNGEEFFRHSGFIQSNKLKPYLK